MNLIERDMLTRCLGPIYEQMLMGDTDAALASIEGVTWLVRYMAAGKSSQRATLENELRAVRAVFQICRGGGGTGDRCLRLGSVPGSEADSGPV